VESIEEKENIPVRNAILYFRILIPHALSDDFTAVLERAKAAGVTNQIITGGSLKESKESLKLAKQNGIYNSRIPNDYRI
jgi:Tat protein secretion system quality control protein TatD with DNase activity